MMNKLFARLGKLLNKINRVEKNELLQREITRALRGVSRVYFIQIGANDGVRKDPLHDLIRKYNHWSGIFVEPVKYIFDRLVQNYGDPNRFIFENVAIGSENGINTFYRLDISAKEKLGDELSNSWEQYGSFYKQHIVDGLGEIVLPYIVESEVQCVTVDSLLRKHNIKRIDLVHIDVEGFDYQVLNQIDYQALSPKVVIYEHSHLSSEEYAKARKRLEEHFYTLREYGGDTLAIRK